MCSERIGVGRTNAAAGIAAIEENRETAESEQGVSTAVDASGYVVVEKSGDADPQNIGPIVAVSPPACRPANRPSSSRNSRYPFARQGASYGRAS